MYYNNRMRFNDKELTQLSLVDSEMEGVLNHRRPSNSNFSQSGYKERLFRLKSNLLFYFRISDIGEIDMKQPAGVIVLENSNIQYEASCEVPFAFSISFRDEPDRKHYFSGRSEQYVHQWVKAMKQATYEYWRSQLILLQTKLNHLTGRDPLLMYPHNEGQVRNYEESSSPGAARRLKSIGMQTSSFKSHLQNSLASVAAKAESKLNTYIEEANLIEL